MQSISLHQITNWRRAIAVFGILVLSGTGLTCLVLPEFNADIFLYVCAAICSLSALFVWYQAFVKKRGFVFLEAVLITAFTVFLWIHRQSGEVVIVGVFAVYLLVNVVAFLVQTVLDLQDKAASWWYDALRLIVYALLLFATVRSGLGSLKYIQYIVGLYLIVQAGQLYFEMVSFSHPQSTRYYSFRHWSSLPVALVAVLPFFVLEVITHAQLQIKPERKAERKNEEPVDLRVFVHTGLSGVHVFGHMTIAYEGMTYSYGNYDTANEKLFRSIGPGILFLCPDRDYINNTCLYEGVTMFEYGLTLTEAQKKELHALMDEIHEQTYHWQSPYEQALQADPDTSFSAYENDYASRLWYRTGSQFYKFKSGEWKTYWILGTNCSLFAADLLNRIDPAIHGSKGIVTPGEFWEYFEEAFADPKSNVIYKAWHSSSDPSTLYDLGDENPVRDADS